MFLLGMIVGGFVVFLILKSKSNEENSKTNMQKSNQENSNFNQALREVQSLNDRLKNSESDKRKLKDEIYRLRDYIAKNAVNDSSSNDNKKVKPEKNEINKRVFSYSKNSRIDPDSSVYERLKKLGVDPNSVKLDGLNTLGVRFD